MRASLLTTKLYIPPPRAGLVPRTRLMQRLDEGLRAGHKLTLVSAPAGFGKTTLIAEWICHLPRDVAWVSLDEEDNDPARFLTYLTAALKQVSPAIGQAEYPTLQLPDAPPIQAVVDSLIHNVAEAPSASVLVLDDYHFITSPAIHQAVGQFLENHLPTLHIVIVTRADPPLPVHQLRARGQMTELRVRDLRFTPDEATAFLREAMGLSITAEMIDALEKRTEGWITGLQLAALTLQQDHEGGEAFVAAFTGDERHVMDYLMEEVLARQPAEVRDFLQQTSILDQLTAPLCNAVTGRDDGQVMLEMLEATNVFLIPLDHRRGRYRYHRLFRRFLHATLDPEEKRGLHSRAKRWYEAQGEAEQAARHATPDAESDSAAYPLVEHLSGRELEVLQLIAAGRKNREIAQELVITLGTVKRHATNIYGKLGVHSRTQAVAKARELGFFK
jgi:LuxR family maltose regulon positive regulatory protein